MFPDVGTACDDGPQQEPGDAHEAGEPECGRPSVGGSDGGNDDRRDDGSEGTAGVSQSDTSRTLMRRQRLHSGAEAAGEGGAFAETKPGSGGGKGSEARGEGVRNGGGGPENDGDSHTARQSDTVEDPSPEWIADHVRHGKSGDDEAVLLGGEAGLAKDRGSQQSERVAIDVADEGDQHHR